ncbi:hypothetical protein AB4Z48_00390 [Cupriavidus sp. 2TAF22]
MIAALMETIGALAMLASISARIALLLPRGKPAGRDARPATRRR